MAVFLPVYTTSLKFKQFSPTAGYVKFLVSLVEAYNFNCQCIRLLFSSLISSDMCIEKILSKIQFTLRTLQKYILHIARANISTKNIHKQSIALVNAQGISCTYIYIIGVTVRIQHTYAYTNLYGYKYIVHVKDRERDLIKYFSFLYFLEPDTSSNNVST